jgi:hypothetical protein
MTAMRNRLAMVLFAVLALIQGCGGGGGGESAPAADTAAPVTKPVLPTDPNSQQISVEPGISNNVNLLTTSVTVCAPGSSSNCQTIDHIVVDTGSSGLRILASALAPTLAQALVQQTDAAGTAVVECAQFVDGYTWGPVKLADARFSSERANSLPLQVIGDSAFPGPPARCAATGPSKNSVQELRANGILGISVFRQDCGSACTVPNNRAMYYVCGLLFCTPAPIALGQQVQNPVSRFAVNNNGVVIDLPSVPDAGAARADGLLVFGIGTQANNALGTATVIGLDPASGNFTTRYKGSSLSTSFIDSGSNGLFFPDSIAVCTGASASPGFYCPPSTINASASIDGTNGASVSVSFSIANADALLSANPGYTAFRNLGASFSANSFDWGLPFFYGRKVYTAIEGAGTPAGPGPYVAF